MTRVIVTAAVLAFGATRISTAGAQTQYFNLDAGRPTRVEDAVPTERYGLDIQLAPVRIERLDDGSYRWRVEPKISFGALPFTEFALRIPYSGVRSRDSSGVRESGVTSMAVGVLRALNLERTRLPAFAVSMEAQLPVGAVAAPRATYSAKLLATKSSALGRAHINLSGGTYSVRVPGSDACVAEPTSYGCGGFIPDAPCSVGGAPSPADVAVTRAAVICDGERQVQRAVATPPRTFGVRWLMGVGADHAFPLQSWLLTADVFAERFQGFQAKTDVTAEAGARWQMTNRLVVDGGISRRFAGTNPSSSITLGLTFAAAARPRLMTASPERGQ